jgi:plastocyanin
MLSVQMMTRFNKSTLWASIGSGSLIATLVLSLLATSTAANAYHTFGGTYTVDIIPGAAQQDSLYHYYPTLIAVPKGTEVSWFNGDSEQPHTVTSGTPDDANKGMMFNSGVMSYQYFFHYEFEETGDYAYYCIIHPWRSGMVHVSDELERGDHFEYSAGTGSTWTLSDFNRNLLKFEPTTLSLDESTPASYYLTMYDNETGQTVYDDFFPSTNNLLIELISSENNQTNTWGPDRASTVHSTPGAYHVQGNFIEPGTYTISVVLYSVNGKLVNTLPVDQFQLEVKE